MEPEAHPPEESEAEKRSPLERLADHGDTVLTWVAIGFVVVAVLLLISLYRKFNNA